MTAKRDSKSKPKKDERPEVKDLDPQTRGRDVKGGIIPPHLPSRIVVNTPHR
jgi:hypothetical protein